MHAELIHTNLSNEEEAQAARGLRRGGLTPIASVVLDDSWAVKPATVLAAAIRDRHVSSRELLELYLDRIERLDRDRSTRW